MQIFSSFVTLGLAALADVHEGGRAMEVRISPSLVTLRSLHSSPQTSDLSAPSPPGFYSSPALRLPIRIRSAPGEPGAD